MTMVALPAVAPLDSSPWAPPDPGIVVAVAPPPGAPPLSAALPECSAAEHPASAQKFRTSQDVRLLCMMLLLPLVGHPRRASPMEHVDDARAAEPDHVRETGARARG